MAKRRNNSSQFRQITMTGRLVYIFMCIEEYLVNMYPQKDWTPVARKMWQWTNKMWDEGSDIYSIVVPEYILEFDTYEKTNRLSFEGKLDRETYDEIVPLFDGITNGDEYDEINLVLKVPVDFNNYCEGTSVSYASPDVDELIGELEELLKERNIPLPDKAKLEHFKYDDTKKTGPLDKEPGWGDAENTECFSIILNK